MKIKIITVLVSCLALTGCPPIYKVNIRNDAPKEIVVFYPYDGTELLIVEANGGEGIEHWSHHCFAINDGGKKLYFDGTSLPNEAFDIHAFSTSLRAIYKDNQLSYLNTSNDVVKIVNGEEKCR